MVNAIYPTPRFKLPHGLEICLNSTPCKPIHRPAGPTRNTANTLISFNLHTPRGVKCGLNDFNALGVQLPHERIGK